MSIFTIFISALLVNNFVLSRFLGICPFLGVSKKVETATGMGAAVTFVMALAAIMTFLVERFILIPLNIQYLSTLAFILVIASLVQFVEMVIKKVSPDLYKALGIYLPLITTNCAVLGMAVINSNEKYNLIQSIINSVGAALGFTLALVLLAGIREKMETNEYIPEALKGLPITLVTAGLMAIAFLGFQGLI
ncbi:electron transport complex protein RnfA [Clostridium tetanomorphum]|uniref:Ion-translocating oxidoreductase complex subunit A n=1 Tax=Clostridium tetanomorphum TaxID=1553 RepID=A0A923J0P9_CLOTT|nr:MULTISPECIES: electron transport complex subunit RsxA [Clostridium]7ZC6_A Chain A, RnfA [Clostridium tetanomorphum]KAJ52776.1 rnfA/nqrE [Clostridium tetanomorphum DSM 665]MBC2396473.1 electron transport complex subunit RsxA [Clostridium tetanomorphum]MBC2425418.1 electron transport complex subunit RsxA [Clostridium beijerinckii]MBP1865359.1 electron transport complex protein RnfA [Clostridium tetanomorphum]NRS84874.1 electron transport complex protein RnfA [Clostridium tetanomorphum]